MTIDGIAVTTLARTGLDLARQESKRNALVVLDAILGRGVPREEVEAVLARMTRWPGVRAAREALRLADGRCESALESLSRWRLLEAELPAPELQVEIWLGGTYVHRADKLWLPEGVVGEDDGLAKFGDDPADKEQSFRALKANEDVMTECGLVLARWGWDDAFGSATKVPDRVRRAFDRARPERLHPELRFVLTTVEDRVRRDAARRRAA